ncbi:hydroxymethylglutaryl-CoA synthase [Cellulomonas sp. PhB143]|uniref:hydroxymethylglutaryl-CoA synthase n=1 Tax=Cellulomonas sp. PhB143 TaxID=2485186 RepID=UPI000F91721F|nr:hydroxymethylglutaryl-CoA synthase [Cellulomonas sp. PhB143]ROS74420.1 hydroxymethylglutaryl-CoA synthase [Cellulomonas sp. PhB143]
MTGERPVPDPEESTLSTHPVGIHDLSVATGSHVIGLDEIAARHGVDPAKYHVGLGQDEMSVLAPDEDVVTLAAAAALPVVERHGTQGLRTLLFATESGIDQSKSAGVYVHRLLGLPATVRTVELKQACYSGTAALQMAAALVARDPAEKVLVVTSDVARYDLDSSGEPTQGAAAVAMLVTADPALLEIEPVTGVHTEDVMDFWRPNHRSTALVDGRASIDAYLRAVSGAWADYAERGGAPFEDIDAFAYHQPFTRMATKAHRHLAKVAGSGLDRDAVDAQIAATTTYNRRTGNSYTSSLYVGLAALLDSGELDPGSRVALVSYGSGAVCELFTGIVPEGYREATHPGATTAALDARTPISDTAYLELHAAHDVVVADLVTPHRTTGPFRYAGLDGHRRQYERNEPATR